MHSKAPERMQQGVASEDSLRRQGRREPWDTCVSPSTVFLVAFLLLSLSGAPSTVVKQHHSRYTNSLGSQSLEPKRSRRFTGVSSSRVLSGSCRSSIDGLRGSNSRAALDVGASSAAKTQMGVPPSLRGGGVHLMTPRKAHVLRSLFVQEQSFGRRVTSVHAHKEEEEDPPPPPPWTSSSSSPSSSSSSSFLSSFKFGTRGCSFSFSLPARYIQEQTTKTYRYNSPHAPHL
mmetsp:Transcript_12384/g.25209  ORF Transcript_12384/g.25209 Transcript_12384/m.25209 type:complete len:231 (+) Transcript_12384:167-859(+)